MKKIIPLFGLLILMFGSCKDECQQEMTYTKAIPKLKAISEIRADISTESPRSLRDPGKIYFYQDYILINEKEQGLHIIDNADPYNPRNIGFINIVGNTEMAIRGNTLYVNNYMDLLALDISDWQNVTMISRSEDLLPGFGIDGLGNAIVGYDYEEVTEMVDCDRGGFVVFEGDVLASDSGGGGFPSQPQTGTGGSLARFTIVSDYLYIVNDWRLEVFDIDNPSAITPTNTVNMGWGIETIFPYGENLFVGSQSGMFIFDNSNPSSPELLSVFEHARACDPVVVQDDIAFVTLRDGNECETFTNQLDVVDVSDLEEPRLIRSYQMENPHGLSIKGDNLFICEGTHGLKSMDASEVSSIELLDYKRDLTTYDVIARPGDNSHLFVIGEGGFYQYDFSDARNLSLMSSILVD